MSTDPIHDYKTTCCNAGWYVKGRANFRCKKCEKDVTLEVCLIADVLDK